MSPITPDDDPKLRKLDAELKEARQEYEKDYNPKTPEKVKNMGTHAGIELIGAIIGGGLIGYGVDYYFETAPIFFFVFILLGIITGFYSILKISMNVGTSVGFKGLKSPTKNAKQASNYDDDDD